MKAYTGVGSRETPEKVQETMRWIAAYLADCGYTLRSGGADGADLAFEGGCDQEKGAKEIYIPWDGFQGLKSSMEGVYRRGDDIHSQKIAATIHPVWDRLTRGAKALHTRNVNQVLGLTSDDPEPSDFLIYYAPRTSSGVVKGGTATAVKLAEKYKVPCYNLYDNPDHSDLVEWVDGLRKR